MGDSPAWPEAAAAGRRYLADVGHEHRERVFGWCFGYPRCCIEWLLGGPTTSAPATLSIYGEPCKPSALGAYKRDREKGERDERR